MSEVAATEQPVEIGRSRRTLLRRLIDYVALPGSQMAPQDRSMAGDVLLEILFHATAEERELCAKRLSHMKEAPRRVLRYLAQCEFNIARHVLEHNEALDASDLYHIVDQVSEDHRRTIAIRKKVPAVVCDRLSEVAAVDTVGLLLRNKDASFSEYSIDVLVERSKNDEKLCTWLIKRLELKPAHAMAMFWWSDGAVRREILQRHSADRLEMIDMCADVFAMAAAEGWADPVARKVLQLIERRQRNRAAIEKSPYDSLEHAISVASATGLTPDLAREIGYLAGVKPVTIAKLLSDSGGEGLAVLCKATGLKRPALKELWQSLKRPLEKPDGSLHPHFAYVLETYELLSVAKAQTTLRYWNWSLSSSYSPRLKATSGLEETEANDEAAFSASRRMAELVFGD